MTTDRPRRLAAVTLAIAVSAGLSGCHTGFNAATNKQYQQSVGANQRDADVRLHNALLVQNADGSFSFSGGLVNTTDEEQVLTSASFVALSGDAASALETEPSAEIAISPQGMVTVGTDGELAGLEIDDVEEGMYVTITFTFETAGDVSVDAPIVRRTADYSDVADKPASSEAEEQTEDEQAEQDAESEADGTAPEGAADAS